MLLKKELSHCQHWMMLFPFEFVCLLVTVLSAVTGCGPQAKEETEHAEEPVQEEHENMPGSLNVFNNTALPAYALYQQISFSFYNKSIIDIIRHISLLTGVDMAVAPDLLNNKELMNREYRLKGINLSFITFLDWCARLMKCSYIEADAPDIWFVYESSWLKETPVLWKGYPLIAGIKGPDQYVTEKLIKELQKGLSWVRQDVASVSDGRKMRIMVNSTEKGHERIDKIVNSFIDKRFIPFEMIAVQDETIDKGYLDAVLSCPKDEESVDSVIKRITKETGLNVGYDSSVYHAQGAGLIPLPLKQYMVGTLLEKIIDRTEYSMVNYDGDNAVWLCTKDEGYFYRNRYLFWDSVDLYILKIDSLSKRIKGEEIVSTIKSSVFPGSWTNPGTVLEYFKPYDVLLIVQRQEVVKEIINYLRIIKKFGKIQIK